jgi:carnitine 3-dehydrogenase
MDVPELDDTLVETIARQSDEQTGALSVRELERIRDDNLVAMIRALAAQRGGAGWGAGALLRSHEERLLAAAREAAGEEAAPLHLVAGRVPETWIDYNGHMTESRYLEVFSAATDALLELIGADQSYVAGGHSYYTVETHVMHLGETKLGEAYNATTQILSTDAKRIHVFHRLFTEDSRELATAEQMLLHVDMKAGRACPAGPEVLDRLQPLAAAHRTLPRPRDAGRAVGARG